MFTHCPYLTEQVGSRVGLAERAMDDTNVRFVCRRIYVCLVVWNINFMTFHIRAPAPAADPGKRGKEERARATFPRQVQHNSKGNA